MTGVRSCAFCPFSRLEPATLNGPGARFACMGVGGYSLSESIRVEKAAGEAGRPEWCPLPVIVRPREVVTFNDDGPHDLPRPTVRTHRMLVVLREEAVHERQHAGHPARCTPCDHCKRVHVCDTAFRPDTFAGSTAELGVQLCAHPEGPLA